jgi:CheY-like chemotaxis protein
MTTSRTTGSEPLWLRSHDLMPFRVREVLLVSSPYDFFILEEDGRLSERIFTAYSDLTLSATPRIKHAPSGATALKLLSERNFDLVLTMVRLEDMDVTAFGRSVKALDPRMPVVLLALAEADLKRWPSTPDSTAVDLVFLWTGDSHILVAIIKQVEDRMNVAHDTRVGDVRVMIVVEDSVRRYSHLLSVLYSELMAQSQSLTAEGLNDLQRLVRMRARPKLLLARTYEEAEGFCQRFRNQLLAVIADRRLPRRGDEDASAGLELVRMIRASDDAIPILLQTAEPDEGRAATLDVLYLHKDDSVLRQIRSFMVTNLGFGDFVFRMPGGSEVARAASMFEMERVLQTVPPESLEYHASRRHISLWLMARSMFDLAKRVRAWKIEELGGIEAARQKLVSALREARLQEQDGVIADFSAERTDSPPELIRLGTGSIGGKGRGIGFVRFMLAQGIADRFPGMEVGVPRTVLLATDYFDQFMEENALQDVIPRSRPDAEIISRFLEARLPHALEQELAEIQRHLSGPLAVRSSSLLEDAHSQPFAGIYATYMLPNNHPDRGVRFTELCRAIKAVYASTYCADARSYVAGTPHALEEERMGVVIQQMVGRRHGDRFYPSISGVALSFNHYPISSQRAEEGLAEVALGLGQIIVQGGAVLQFSPGASTVMPQFPSPRDFLRISQSVFLALDLSQTRIDFLAGPESNLSQYTLEQAEEDGTLWPMGSVYVVGEDRIRDRLDLAGPRVVTFNNILKWKAIPLAPALEELLRIFRTGLGCAVEIEFAIDMADYGRDVQRGQERASPRLYLLQIRPQGFRLAHQPIDAGDFGAEEVLCRTDRSLGHGIIDDIADVVYVRRMDLGHLETPGVAARIGAINAELVEEKCPYLLIGPGRWGTSDPALGIPVAWSQISGARVIVEAGFPGRAVEPSQGTHFFHNIVSFEVGYLTVTTSSASGTASSVDPAFFDLEWLGRQPAERESPDVRHVRLARPLRVFLDGRNGKATILKPAAG